MTIEPTYEFLDLLHEYGRPYCEEHGHDWIIPVVNTRNMWLCFRCGEPGWQMPS